MGRAYAEKHLPLSWCPTAADLDKITAKSITTENIINIADFFNINLTERLFDSKL